MQYDRDRSGTIDPNELRQAINSWGEVYVVCFQNYIILATTQVREQNEI